MHKIVLPVWISALPKVLADKLQMIECTTEWWWYTVEMMAERESFTVIFAMTFFKTWHKTNTIYRSDQNLLKEEIKKNIDV